jgi:prepilin-type N-terminal cleavage/methylation domain-containing protein
MRHTGFVLIELLLALVIAAIVAAIALPRLVAVVDAAAVRTELMRLVGAVDAARGTAERLGTVATLHLDDSGFVVTAVVNGSSLQAWRERGTAEQGVTLSGAGQPIDFGPSGLAMGVANRTFTLSRGSAARNVVMSRYGRLTY